jgi:TRAP-type transport system periplasmic protein
MKRLSVLLVVFIVISSLILIGCSSSTTSTTSAPASAAQTPAAAPQTIKLSWASWVAPTESFFAVANDFIADISKRTNGRVQITFYPGGSLVQQMQAYDGAVNNIANISEVMKSMFPDRFPLTYGWGLPVGFKNGIQATKVMNQMYAKYKYKEMSDVHWLWIFGSGNPHLLTNKPIKTINDVKGLKIKCLGTNSEQVKAWGATPVVMATAEAYDALKKGILDGAVQTTNQLYDFKLAEVVKYSMYVDVGVAQFADVMNSGIWNSLPPDIQKVFDDMGAEYTMKQANAFEANLSRGLEFAVKQGVQVMESGPDLTADFDKVKIPIRDKFVADMKAKGFDGQAFLDETMNLIKQNP